MLSLLIVAAAAAQASAAAGAAVTFSRDVAPIIFAHCASCHRDGGGAPFRLLTYADVRRRATQIAFVTRTRDMPPWKPEVNFGTFEGERRLTADQVEIFQQWVAQGALEGEAADLPAAPEPGSRWRLGNPDLVVALPHAYQLQPDGPDVFRTFVVPVPQREARQIKGFEFDAGEPAAAVHHASLKIDRTRSSRQLDDRDAEPGYDGGAGRNARFPDGHFLSWTPGQSPYLLPAGMGWRLEPGSDLVLELHLMPTGKAESIRPSVGFYFSDRPPTELSYILRLGSQTIDIPAGEPSYVVTDSVVLPVGADVFGLQPHAHSLATEMKAFARLPDGTTRWLLYIKEWDFKWQEVYRFKERIRLPAGTTLTMHYTYDNSTANPRNPNRPPKRVTFGQTTKSEMGNLWLQVIPRDEADLAVLERSFAAKLLEDDIAGYEKAIEVAPADSRLHLDLAYLYLARERTGDATARLHEAVRLSPDLAEPRYALGTVFLGQRNLVSARAHLEAAIRLRPGFSEAHGNLGVVSFAEGRLAAAIASYQRALQLDPDNAQARYNLGRARASSRQFDEAIAEYRHALRLRPDDGDVLSSLGAALSLRGDTREAVDAYRRALAVNPDQASALLDLAWILATSDSGLRAPQEAVRLAERLAVLTRRENAVALDTLGLAYFAAGRAADAIRTAEAALEIAGRTGPPELVEAIRVHLSDYARH